MVQSEGLPYVNCHEFRFFVSFLLTDFSIFITNKRLQMKKLAQDAKVKAQAERHAKLLAEREAQKTA